MQDHIHTGFVQLAITTAFVIVAIQVLRGSAVWLSARDNDLAVSAGKVLGALTTFSK